MLNPYLLLGIAIAWVVSLGIAAYTGKDYADGQHAKEEVRRAALIEEVRKANAEFADKVSIDVGAAILNIRVQNTTINREIRHEREIHRVLDNPDCALPATTRGVLDRARRGEDSGQGTSKPAPAVPAASAAPGKGAAR